MADSSDSGWRAATKTALAGQSKVTVSSATTVQVNAIKFDLPAGTYNVPTVVADILVAAGLGSGKTTADAGKTVTETLANR